MWGNSTFLGKCLFSDHDVVPIKLMLRCSLIAVHLNCFLLCVCTHVYIHILESEDMISEI